MTQKEFEETLTKWSDKPEYNKKLNEVFRDFLKV